MSDSPAIDMQQLLREIDEEVEARRAAGDFPPGMERDLDLIFARFAPPVVAGDDLDALLEGADRGSFVDVDVPTGSRLPAVSIVKRLLRKLMSWYLRYVTQQVSVFAGSTVAALRVLRRRLETLEAATPGADPAVREAAQKAATTPDFDAHATAIVEHLRGVTGRVLVAECGDAALVLALADAGIDAYGCEPRHALADDASQRGVEVRDDHVLDHLRAIEHGALGALVLAGAVDRQPIGAQLAMADLAFAVLAAGGRLVIVATQPDAWGRSTSVVEADLAPGKPLHAETWVHLLDERGFRAIDVRRSSPQYLVLATR